MEQISDKENVALIKYHAKFDANLATFFLPEILFCIFARVLMSFIFSRMSFFLDYFYQAELLKIRDKRQS